MDVFAKTWNSCQVILSVTTIRHDLFQWKIRLRPSGSTGAGHIVAEGNSCHSYGAAAGDGMQAIAAFGSGEDGVLEPSALFDECRGTLH